MVQRRALFLSLLLRARLPSSSTHEAHAATKSNRTWGRQKTASGGALAT